MIAIHLFKRKLNASSDEALWRETNDRSRCSSLSQTAQLHLDGHQGGVNLVCQSASNAVRVLPPSTESACQIVPFPPCIQYPTLIPRPIHRGFPCTYIHPRRRGIRLGPKQSRSVSNETLAGNLEWTVYATNLGKGEDFAKGRH